MSKIPQNMTNHTAHTGSLPGEKRNQGGKYGIHGILFNISGTRYKNDRKKAKKPLA